MAEITVDQQTASREAIAKAVHDGPNAQRQYFKAGISAHSWDFCPYQSEYLADADAVLAVLRPIGLIRAETLVEAARVLRAEFEPLVNRVPDWHLAEAEMLRAAAEYRKGGDS